MKLHTLMMMLALLVSSGAFAQNNTSLKAHNAEAESVMASNIKAGKDYHDGLTKVYTVQVDADSYSDSDTHYLSKTESLIQSDLGYSSVSSKIQTLSNGQKIAVFTFSGNKFTDLKTIKERFTEYGFNLIDLHGELQKN